MATTNDITGDTIATGVNTDAFRDGHDRIFGKKKPMPKTLGEMIDEECGNQSTVEGELAEASQ